MPKEQITLDVRQEIPAKTGHGSVAITKPAKNMGPMLLQKDSRYCASRRESFPFLYSSAQTLAPIGNPQTKPVTMT